MSEFKTYIKSATNKSVNTKPGTTKSWNPVTRSKSGKTNSWNPVSRAIDLEAQSFSQNEDRCCCPVWVIILLVVLGIILVCAGIYYATREDENPPVSNSNSGPKVQKVQKIPQRKLPSGPSQAELDRRRRENERLKREEEARRKREQDRLRREKEENDRQKRENERRKRENERQRRENERLRREAERLEALRKKQEEKSKVDRRVQRINKICTNAAFARNQRKRKKFIPRICCDANGRKTHMLLDPEDAARYAGRSDRGGQTSFHFYKNR